MSEMVERVAKAINKEAYENQCRVIGLPPDEARAYARAAIEAMAEPTKEMLMASGLYGGKTTRGKYKAMLTAALSPSREDEGK